jgi:WD40 repeat protein
VQYIVNRIQNVKNKKREAMIYPELNTRNYFHFIITAMVLLFALPCFAKDKDEKDKADGKGIVYSTRKIKPNGFRLKEKVNVLALSPDGKVLATGCPSGKPNIILWDIETGKKKYFLPASHHVNGVGFSADGKRVYAMSMGGTEHLEIWNVESGKKEKNLRLFGRGAYKDTFRHDFSHCGKKFLTLEKDSNQTRFRFLNGRAVQINEPVLGIWDLEQGKRLKKFNGFPGRVGRFFPDGKKFIVGTLEGKLLIADSDSGKITKTLKNSDAVICDIRFSPDKKFFVVADADGGVTVWKLDKRIKKKKSFQIPKMPRFGKAVFPIEISADCSRVAANTGKSFVIYDIKSGKKKSEFGKGGKTPLTISSDGKFFAHMSPEGAAVWKVD